MWGDVAGFDTLSCPDPRQLIYNITMQQLLKLSKYFKRKQFATLISVKPAIRVRRARETDKRAILSFCQKLPDNQDDYIPKVWDRWIAEPEGPIFVASLDEVALAMYRIVILSEFEAWWEGLRVHPDYRHQGISKLLALEINSYLNQERIPISRTCVLSGNQIVIDIMSRRSREKIAQYGLYEAKAINSPSALVRLTNKDLDSIWSKVTEGRKELILYVNRGAKWQELTIAQLKKLVNEKKVWAFKGNNSLLGIAIESYSESSFETFRIGYVSAKPENLPAFLSELQKLAANQGYSQVGGFLPLSRDFSQALIKADYQKIEKQDFWLYQWKNTL